MDVDTPSLDYASCNDQMQLIDGIIGSPDESEINKMTNEKVRKYLRNLPQRKKNLIRIFPAADKNTLDLFTQLLKFDSD